MMDTGRPVPQNRIVAAPPRIVKMGAPRAVARASVINAGQINFSGSIGDRLPIQTKSAVSAKANPKPIHLLDASQHRLSIIAALVITKQTRSAPYEMPYLRILSGGSVRTMCHPTIVAANANAAIRPSHLSDAVQQ